MWLVCNKIIFLHSSAFLCVFKNFIFLINARDMKHRQLIIKYVYLKRGILYSLFKDTDDSSVAFVYYAEHRASHVTVEGTYYTSSVKSLDTNLYLCKHDYMLRTLHRV
jgi:hypothetical protein